MEFNAVDILHRIMFLLEYIKKKLPKDKLNLKGVAKILLFKLYRIEGIKNIELR
jgi:hypothetical protein